MLRFLFYLLAVLPTVTLGQQTDRHLPLKALYLNQGFGWRKHPVTGRADFHRGVDFCASFEGVYSILAGRVLSAGQNAVSGKYLIISHGQVHSHYAHLSLFLTLPGDSVTSGQLIGISGDSGRVTGPHLHFAVSMQGMMINPVKFLFGIHKDH